MFGLAITSDPFLCIGSDYWGVYVIMPQDSVLLLNPMYRAHTFDSIHEQTRQCLLV